MNRPDPDDWFADAGFDDVQPPETAPVDDATLHEEDWLGEETFAPPPRTPRANAVNRRILVVGASLVVLLLAGLAAGGVFSGGKSKPPLPTTAPARTTAQTPTTSATTTTPKTPQVAAPTTTLKPGDTGTEVAALQRALISLGFAPGKVDGRYGPVTTAAVMQFQRKQGLTVDGIVGPVTLPALATALRA